ncbi:hypothetical protein JCM11641_005869 [Rhodosporidiobolus odoratus]
MDYSGESLLLSPYSASHAAEIFTVVCRSTAFTLTREQIETDAPNYFTTAFLDGGFAEASSRIIRTDRNPQLFALIFEHLSGYEILPLHPGACPATMSLEAASESLLRDAEYFQLSGLVSRLKPKPVPLPAPQPRLVPPYQRESLEAIFDGANSVVSLEELPSVLIKTVTDGYRAEVRPTQMKLPFLIRLEGVGLALRGDHMLQLVEAISLDIQRKVGQGLRSGCRFGITPQINVDREFTGLVVDGTLTTVAGAKDTYGHATFMADTLYLSAELHFSSFVSSVVLWPRYRYAECRTPRQLLKEGALPPHESSD